MHRPGRQNLLSHVRTDGVVWLGRLGRRGRSTLATLQKLEQCGVRVRSAKPGGELQGATGS